ncbi:Uncharacterised protein [Mycolicibacterium vanbaalenii]|uniref:PASTA domain-containing protein n=1 Tax=Mycolicibacterium vanbaalenii TaxID=110539 RepID=A0A5S9R2D0_MYCVN|nr:Uncharacterised protein [Mycolicibacterium vanbaalenii]
MSRKQFAVVGVTALLASLGVAVAAPASAQSWTMPNLIGTDLQGAQDAVQSVSGGDVWLSTSTDLTGQGRAQILDRAWVVCSSTPPPGAPFTTTTEIDFGVVKKDIESCP